MALTTTEQHDIAGLLGREPTPIELSIFDTMWSEHCSYKSSKPVLRTLPTDGPNIMLGVGEDSGIVAFATHNGHRYGIAISHESHNHPSQILPVEGAATGVGGVVRDVYCMGADVIGVLDSLHFGIAPDDGYHMVGHIAEHVVKGIADYGNPLGVPNVGGDTVYHASYNENCLVNVAAAGLVREDRIIRSKVPECAKTIPYVMILIGKTTDATGYGGASFSSAVLEPDNAAQNLGAVQVHDPFMKRVLVVAIDTMLAYVHEQGIEIGFKDLGAGGIACATSELAVAGGFGCELNVDHVPVVDTTLPPEVIACSETQERFCVVAPANHASAICNIFNQQMDMGSLYPGAGAAVIGTVIPESQYRIRYRQSLICNLPVSAITTEVLAERHATPRPIHRSVDTVPDACDLQSLALAVLSGPNATQKKYIYRHYDQFVKNNHVLIPGEADAGVLAPIRGCKAGVALTIDSNVYGQTDPYVAGAYAVAEAIRNVIAVGAEPIALTDCLNYGNPENPDVFFDFQEGVRGIADAAQSLSPTQDVVPIVSGNVSFYNESASGQAVVPSPVICCIGRMDDAERARPMQMSIPNAHIVLLGARYAEFSDTIVSHHVSHTWGTVPQVRFDDERAMNQAMLAIHKGLLAQAVHDVSQGGVWQSLVDMLAGDRNWPLVGADITCPKDWDPFTFLFSENGGYVCEVPDTHIHDVKAICQDHGVLHHVIGHTTDALTCSLHIDGKPTISWSLNQLMTAWNAKNLVTPGTPIYNDDLKGDKA
tara:strand:+ start:978 stop:3275 length:2298 start_codon:yes stop_codon:yes gene_type:complete